MSNYHERPEDMPSVRERDSLGGGVALGHGPRARGTAEAGARGLRMRRGLPIETKPFFLTSEFGFAMLTYLAIGLTAAITEAVDAWHAILLVTAVTGSYLLSRGIAKAGTRSMAADPREQLEFGSGASGAPDGR